MILPADFSDHLQVDLWILPEQFDNVRMGLPAPGIQLKRHELRDRHDLEQASGTDPDIIAFQRIGYETSPVNNQTKAYEMFVFPSVGREDSQVFMWIRVDLHGIF